MHLLNEKLCAPYPFNAKEFLQKFPSGSKIRFTITLELRMILQSMRSKVVGYVHDRVIGSH